MAEQVKKRSLLDAMLETKETNKPTEQGKRMQEAKPERKTKDVYEEIPDDEERAVENERRAKLKQTPLPKQYRRKAGTPEQSDAMEEKTETVDNAKEETEEDDNGKPKKKAQPYADPKKSLLKALYGTLGG